MKKFKTLDGEELELNGDVKEYGILHQNLVFNTRFYFFILFIYKFYYIENFLFTNFYYCCYCIF